MSYGYQIFIHSHNAVIWKENIIIVGYITSIISYWKLKKKTIMITFYFDMMCKYILSYIV